MYFFKLSNGIPVIFEKMDYIHTVTLGVYVKSGSAFENRYNNGISHIIEHMLFKGTKKHNAKELANITAFIGDDVNAYTGKENTAFYGTTTAENFSVLADMLSDMLFNSTFELSQLHREKEIIINEIDMYNDSADDVVHEQLEKKCFYNQPIGLIVSGTKSNVKRFTREEIINYYEKYYVPSNMVISAAGNYDENAVRELFEQKFGIYLKSPNADNGVLDLRKDMVKNETLGSLRDNLNLAYHKCFDLKNMPVQAQINYRKCFLAIHREIEQVHINMAFPGIRLYDRDRFIYAIMNSIFGGSNNSRLFQVIREDCGLAYNVYSYESAFSNAGLFHIDVTVMPRNTMKAIKAVIGLISDFIKYGVTDEELRIHKAQVCTELIMETESSSDKAENNARTLLYSTLYDIKPVSVTKADHDSTDFIKKSMQLYMTAEEKIEAINSVTKEQINSYIKKHLCLSECSLCIVGDKNQINFKQSRHDFVKIINEKKDI